MNPGAESQDTLGSHDISEAGTGERLSASISLEAANALKAEFVTGAKSAAHQRAEIRGILFGTIETQPPDRFIVRIEQTASVPIGLPDADDVQFAEMLQSFEGRPVIGWYRNCVQPDQSLIEQNRDFAARHFPSQAGGLLLCYQDTDGNIKANIGLWNAGLDDHRFNLDLGDASGPEPAPEVSGPRIAWSRVRLPDLFFARWLRVGGVCAGVLLGAEAVLESDPMRNAAAFPELASALPRKSPTDSREAGPLNLRVTRQSDAVRVYWNEDAPEIVQAQTATLSIVDGRKGKVLHMTPQDLQTGNLLYLVSGDDIELLLRVNGPAGSFAQSVRVVGPEPASVTSAPTRQSPAVPTAPRVALAVPQVKREREKPASDKQQMAKTFVAPPAKARMPRAPDLMEPPVLDQSGFAKPVDPALADQSEPLAIDAPATTHLLPRLLHLRQLRKKLHM